MQKESKNILVTGGYGFLGGNFIRFLRDNFPQHRITCIDKDGYASNQDYVKGLCDKEYKLDIVNTLELENVFLTNDKFDYIFHFAAESHVDNSISGPKIFIESNVLGTQNMIECFRKINNNYGKFVHINYGPNQHSEKFIPTIIKALSKGQKVPVYGEGLNIREWIHVYDHNLAVWSVATNGNKGVYNIGSGFELSNIELVDKICVIMGKDLDKSVIFVEDRLGHDFRYSINSEKIRNELAFETLYNDFDDQLEELVKIYGEK